MAFAVAFAVASRAAVPAVDRSIARSSSSPREISSSASIAIRGVAPLPTRVVRRASGRARSLACRASVPREIGVLALRVTTGVFMVHNGLDKLADPEGFGKFVVEPYLGFLPHDDPLTWTNWAYLAAGAELAGAAGLTLGFLTRLSALTLTTTMGLAVYFHIAQSGLEGFPLAVVEKHQYAYETAALYAAVCFYFFCAGGGAVSVDNLTKKSED